MYRMAWYDWHESDGANIGDTGASLRVPWYEYVVEDVDAVGVATREILLAWEGELKRWRERKGFSGHSPEVCLNGMGDSVKRRSPIGYTVYFVENAFRVEPVNA